MKKRTIKTQLIFGFAALSVLIIGSISFITAYLMNTHFERYIMEKQNEMIKQTEHSVLLAYNEDANTWDTKRLRQINESIATKGQWYILFDVSGNSIFSPTESEQIDSQKEMKALQEKNPTKTEEMTKIFNLEDSNGREIATLDIHYVGPLNYTKHDLAFMRDMKMNLLIVSISAFFFLTFIVTWMSRRLSYPLVRLNEKTKEIAEGNRLETMLPESSTIEINELVLSINELSRRLGKQNELRNRLTTDIAHELRTPLTTVKAHIEAMIDGIWPVTPERLRSCYDEVDRLTRLIGSIEQISAIESHIENLDIRPFDLKRMLFTLRDNFEAQYEAKEVELEIISPEIELVADEDKIRQVITNLLANALKFTPALGKVIVQAADTGDEVIIKVMDTGEGIPIEEQEYIFNRFYMTNLSRNNGSRGKGIGLAIARSIIRAHKGNIRVESELGKGSIFIIQLPK
ncbi:MULTISPECIES: cell wall metabolism sensor histidine kinase WalK [unclassified Listeria]|uniref:sensor histidine kinase n=1 Tax=unclassified Listeria TaxID=2642072 RepID=UPI000B593568|nr:MULTISPECIES: HAMP domain-containing sensor histidine kinase [unclassified Listeria]